MNKRLTDRLWEASDSFFTIDDVGLPVANSKGLWVTGIVSCIIIMTVWYLQ